MHINPNKAGLILGVFLGLFHLLWAVLVATGIAQPMMDLILKLHFLNNPFTLAEFNALLALGLIVLTFVVGYIVGLVLALLWNSLHK